MGWIDALLLGIIQGLTEFLPVSSSGHLEIGKVLLGLKEEENITFTIVVHSATVLSTIIIFRKQILSILKGLFAFSWNEETKYSSKIVLSMIPAVLVGLFFQDEIESLFTGNLMLVGFALLYTAALLAFTFYAKPRESGITFKNAFIIGVSQAIAILPGISRSGSTIATGLLLGSKKEETAAFSFLMVIPVILGAMAKDILDMSEMPATELNIDVMPLVVGFIAAFVTGLLACNIMLKIVKNGKLIWFAVYCAIVGCIALATSFI